MKTKDLFAHKSKEWDANSKRVQGAKAIADSILKKIDLKSNMHIMDFGAGTGLLSYCLSHRIGKVTAIDNSPSMLEVFAEKASLFNCSTEMMELDLSRDVPSHLLFDGIVSSMTIHHIKNIEDMLNKMYHMLPDGGFIALADLDSEDGTFHSDNEGVFHFGFDREEIVSIAKRVGFEDVEIETANIIKKPHSDFGVFLLTAKR
jgi:cyclopropane fatty-acyl-phospholipid synthase-like methyltransferase